MLVLSREEIFVDCGQEQRFQDFCDWAESVVMYSIAIGPICWKWNMLSLSGPKALLFLQLLIAFITRSAVNVRAIAHGFLLVSLVTTLVSLEEVCLPSFEVLNCWLNLVASCLDNENVIPLKVIASFSDSGFALPSVPLIVLHSLVRSVFWSMVSTKSPFFFLLCTHIRFWMVQVPHGVLRTVGMWCDTALSRTVRKEDLIIPVGL